MMNNKRGQIPILMLFVVAIILVIAALYSFYSFSRQFGDSSLPNSQVIAVVQFGQDYVVESAKLIAMETIKANGDKGKFMEIAKTRDYQVPESGNFSAKIRAGDFDFALSGEMYKLNITGLFVRSVQEHSEITRRFDMCMLFDKTGQYVSDC